MSVTLDLALGVILILAAKALPLDKRPQPSLDLKREAG